MTRAKKNRPLRAAVLCVAALALAYLGLQGLSHRQVAAAALRNRILGGLQDHLGPIELGPEVGVDWLFRVHCGPAFVRGLRRGDPPLLTIRSIRFRPDFVAILMGHPRAASLRLEGVLLDLPDRAGAAREALRRLARSPRVPVRSDEGTGASAAWPLRVQDLTVAFFAEGKRIASGPIQANLFRSRDAAGRSSTTVDLSFPGNGQGTVSVVEDDHGWHATARVERVGPGAVPPALRSLASGWTSGTVSVALSGDATPSLRAASARLEIRVDGLEARAAALAAEPVGPFDFRAEGEVTWSAEGRRLAVPGARFELPGGAEVLLDGRLSVSERLPFEVDAWASGVDFLRTVSALPPPLSLPAAAPHPGGSLDARARVAGPLFDPSGWAVEASLDLSRMREAARRAAPVPLLASFVKRAEDEWGPPQDIVVGPENRGFVPIAELPRYLVRAVTAAEDAGFFAHSGFDFEELRNAAVEGAQQGRVVRGGSTISQQLAKNLYLSPERTLARKIREAEATVALEATVPKQRLMEIYLNMVEWGPGLYGIGPAALHWFGKDARDLTPKEAAFLATVIPNPVRYHAMWDRGFVGKAWERRVDELLLTMNGQGNLSDEELDLALREPIVFARPAAEGDAAPSGEGPGDPPPPAPRAGSGRRGWTPLR